MYEIAPWAILYEWLLNLFIYNLQCCSTAKAYDNNEDVNIEYNSYSNY